MLDKVLETSKFVVDNAKHVKINYDKANELIDELLKFDNVHYLTKVPYGVYDMSTRDIINFLLIYDSIDFSFWGNPKWTINVNGKDLDGGIALLHCIFNMFDGRDSVEVYKQLENMTLEDFKEILKGNIDIPLLEERYKIVSSIAEIVNKKMNGSFYDYIKDMNTDQEIFKTILNNFSGFEDTRTYKGQTVYFYKLAQLLTSDILHVIENKEQKEVDYSNLLGCADYKIPQVMQGFGILEYDTKLSSLLETKTEIEENSEYEVEIRASMIVVINYIWEQIDKIIDRIDINDFIWSKGQDKTKKYKPYHLTRTKSY
ncbi:MAG: queuosine salvage family protein [Mollicutes bacterium]|nr:queuosine salvage family protein [Mollicutes bacterium]MDD6403145.1 queuosine salvage family protein [Mollicutes bacterium]